MGLDAPVTHRLAALQEAAPTAMASADRRGRSTHDHGDAMQAGSACRAAVVSEGSEVSTASPRQPLCIHKGKGS